MKKKKKKNSSSVQFSGANIHICNACSFGCKFVGKLNLKFVALYKNICGKFHMNIINNLPCSTVVIVD